MKNNFRITAIIFIMDLEFNFYVRDRLKEHFHEEDLAKLELKDYPLSVSKEVVIDIMTYCSLGTHAKNNCIF